MTLGYGQIWSSNVSNFIGAVGVSNSGLYDRSESKFLNLVHDFNTAIRMAVEFDQFNTHYAFDGAVAHDNRYMLATYFRF